MASFQELMNIMVRLILIYLNNIIMTILVGDRCSVGISCFRLMLLLGNIMLILCCLGRLLLLGNLLCSFICFLCLLPLNVSSFT